MNTPESDGFIDYPRKVQCMIASKYPVGSIHNKTPITLNSAATKNDFATRENKSNLLRKNGT
jgi:hypothetical protein